jgi:retinol dehydrogenase-12
MGTNHLAHFLLTLGLLPALRRGAATPEGAARLGGARAVHVSSSMLMFGGGLGTDPDPTFEAPGRYSAEAAYGRSKLAQVLFTRELRRRLAAEAEADAKDAAAAAADAGPGRSGPRWHEMDGVHAAGPPAVQVYAVHPGYVLTDVVRTLPEAVQRAYRLLMSRILLTPEQGGW